MPLSGRARSTGNRPTDEQLLDAAVETFHSLGYRDATMNAIAEAADTTKPTLYAHFGDKEALYTRAVQREADRMRDTLFVTYDHAATLSMAEEIRADMLALFRYARANPTGFRLVFARGAQPPAAATIRNDMTKALVARIAFRIGQRLTRAENPAPTTSATVLAELLVGVAVTGGHTIVDTGLSPELVGTMAADLVAEGLTHMTDASMTELDRGSTG